MDFLIALALLALGLVVFDWLMGERPTESPDPDNARDVGFMAGMLGGEIKDAFVAESALRRAKEEEERRKAEL